MAGLDARLDTQSGDLVMNLSRFPELRAFLSTYFPHSDAESDDRTARAFLVASASEHQKQVIAQVKLVLLDPELSTEDLGNEANRWFGGADEARAWLRRVLEILEGSQSKTNAVPVEDSNGTLLAEGDSVQVIKDLKVKGGSSDLKRGTIIKKIHLIDNADHIECRVDGSTLVLKACFLKKV